MSALWNVPLLARADNPAGAPLAVIYWLILLLAVAGLAVWLVRRWESRRALVRRLAELSILLEVGQALSGAQLDVAQLAELLYRLTSKLVDTSTFQLGLFEADRYRLLIWIVAGQRQAPGEFILSPANPGIVGWLRSNRRGLLVRDFQRERPALPAQPSYVSPDPPRSGVFVPLVAGGSALGVFAIQSHTPNAFGDDDLRHLSIIGNQAAAIFENARLFEQAQRRASQLELLAAVARQINVLQTLPALYRQIVDLAAEKFTDYTVGYYECAANANQLELRVSSAAVPTVDRTVPAPGFAMPATAATPDIPNWIKLGDGPIGEAAVTRHAVSVQALPEYLPGPDAAAGDRPPQPLPQLAVPVAIDERVLGVLTAWSKSGRAFDESTLAVFESLAAQMAIAILEAELYAAEQRRADQLSALAQVSRTVVSTLELDDLLDEVLDVLNERFAYKTARIFLLHDDRLVFQAGIGQGTVRQSIDALAYPLDGPGLIALVGRSRQPILVDDVTQRPEYVPGPGLSSTRSEMAAPMTMGPRLLGVLDVQSDQPGAFSEEDARTLRTLADTLAVAVRNARLFEYERRRRRLAEIMREVSVALTSTLQLDHVLDLILDGLALVVSYDAASILLVLEGDAGDMILRASRGAPGAQDAIGTAFSLKRFGEGETVPPVLPCSEVDENQEYHALVPLPEPHACLAAPLAPGGEHLGYLVVDRGDQKRFPQGEVELIATFASQAAVAIENARLYTAQREQAWISTALLQVADAMARAPELGQVLDTVARLTPMLVGVDRCAILMADSGSWRLAAYSGSDDLATVDDHEAQGDPRRRPAEVPVQDWSRFAELLERRSPVVLDPDEPMPAGLRELFPGVAILLPLLARGEVEGVMVVGQVPGEIPFTSHRIGLLSGIANQAALALESALLDAAQQEEAWVSTALLQVAESVAGQPLDVALETVARLTPILVGIEQIAIYQHDPLAGAFRLRQVTGLDHDAAAALQERAITLTDLGLATDDPLLNTDPPWRLALPPDLAALFGRPDCSIWPLRARGHILGALVTDPQPLLGRRLAILNGIAYQLAMAMENARLTREVAQQERLERELEVGRDIQASFLPQHYPKAPGWEVAAFWRAARQVGGDFYDFVPLPPTETGPRWGIVIADVADKGVPAALFMALSRTLLRTVAIGRVDPADTLRRVNELILADARSQQFVTIFYGVLEPATGRFRYAIGGHNPPVWARENGTVGLLPGHGIALGVLDRVEYEEYEIQINPGDTLVLYTDGLNEAVNQRMEEFGMPRLLEIVQAKHHQPAQALLESIAAAVEAHASGVEVFDDMTIVVLKQSEAAGQTAIEN